MRQGSGRKRQQEITAENEFAQRVTTYGLPRDDRVGRFAFRFGGKPRFAKDFFPGVPHRHVQDEYGKGKYWVACRQQDHDHDEQC